MKKIIYSVFFFRRRRVLTAVIYCAVTAATPPGGRGGRRGVSASFTGAATSSVRSVYGTYKYPRAIKVNNATRTNIPLL